jgi:uncharacterized protein (TIGR03118 family)
MRLFAISLFIATSSLVLAGSGYVQSALTADTSGFGAAHIDAQLLDPWGMVIVHDGTFAVADRGSGLITFYTDSGVKLPSAVVVPPAPGSAPGSTGLPTGLVLNNSGDFVIQKDGKSAPALLLVDTLDGLICGWNPSVDVTHALIVVDNSAKAPFPASYTALTMARNRFGQNVLYAADSGSGPTTSNNEVDMFGAHFGNLGHFTDLNVPSGMTVFGVQDIDDKIYTTFASFDIGKGGVVDIFDTQGNLLSPNHFAFNSPGGPLEEPWGIVQAPNNFGTFGGALLVGNFSEGQISAFDAKTGAYLGQLTDPQGNTIATEGLGLWQLLFGEGGPRGEPNQLFFVTGPNFEADGVFGVIEAHK